MSGIAPIKASPYEAPPPPTTTAAGASARPASDAAPAPILGSKPAPEATDSAAATAHPTPAEQAAKSKDSAEALQKQLDEMLAEANAKTSLRFRVDKEAHRIVVTVIDEESGETIMQIPDARALAAAKRFADSGTGLLDQQA